MNLSNSLRRGTRSIPSAKISITRQRTSGRIAVDGIGKLVTVIRPKPVQIAFHRYLESASAAIGPLSAVSWKRQHIEFAGLDDNTWLLYAIHAIQMLGGDAKGKLQSFPIKRHEAPASHLRSGNIVVTDVEIWKKY
jgi:hypothetical protein